MSKGVMHCTFRSAHGVMSWLRQVLIVRGPWDLGLRCILVCYSGWHSIDSEWKVLSLRNNMILSLRKGPW
jgi:hypothetical protein